LGIVLVGDMRPEASHHRVADVLVDGPSEACDLRNDLPKAAVHKLGHRFGRKLLRQRGEAVNVDEEGRDQPKLSFRSRVERDPAGGIRGGKRDGLAAASVRGRATGGAKTSCRRERGAALPADGRELLTALRAEIRACWSLALTARTAHRSALLRCLA